ncbi:hypothetical protein [Sphingomonas sp. MA1305]|nr:hypothetical protein [Sphingomonas sp. MA1305]
MPRDYAGQSYLASLPVPSPSHAEPGIGKWIGSGVHILRVGRYLECDR